MIQAIDWTNVHLAGAFLIGWLFGTIVTLRLMRVVSTVIRRELTERPGEPDA